MNEAMNNYDAMSSVAGVFGIVAIVFYLVLMVVYVLMVIAQWKLFIKMNEPGWAAIIPFYNQWIWCKHTMGSGWWMLGGLIPYVGFVVQCIQLWKTYKGCGKSTLFSIVGLFFSPISLMICAFDSSTFTDQSL
jgi:hypothetical protein